MNEPIPVKEMKKKLEQNFNVLWTESFGILEDGALMLGGMHVKKDNKEAIAKLKQKVSEMEIEVIKYKGDTYSNFNEGRMERYKLDLSAFKNNVFGKKLWTVEKALTDMSNPELKRYRDSFNNATAKEVYEHVRYILQQAKNYIEHEFPTINLRTVKTVEDMKLDFLEDENMLMSNVIGLGIRSELLHRMYPAVFPIMTRRSLWGMYFLTNADEFIVDENWEGKSRTSHQWNYEYERFCFYNNFLTNIMEAYLDKYKIKMQNELRYGYINLMLVENFRKHKPEIDRLYTWEYTRL